MTSPTDVWIAANEGVSHYNGSAWSTVTSLASGATSVWAHNANDVWVTETNGEMAHWNGSYWSQFALGATSLSWVYGLPSGMAWAVGGGQMFVHAP